MNAAIPLAAPAELAAQDLDCYHRWFPVSDAIGNFAESHLWQEITYMECSICGATRDLTDADEERLRDDAAAERWDARELDRSMP